MRRAGIIAIGLLLMMPVAGKAAPPCLGDCDGDGVVTPEEYEFVRSCVIQNTQVIVAPSDECLECVDGDGSGSFSINELIAVATNAALGCPGNPRCDGDCDGDRRVVVSEILYGVGAALNGVPADDPCPDFAFCPIGDFCIGIATLQRAVDHALHGCPHASP